MYKFKCMGLKISKLEYIKQISLKRQYKIVLNFRNHHTVKLSKVE